MGFLGGIGPGLKVALKIRSIGKSGLDIVLVGLARADDAGVFPDRNSPPLPGFFHARDGLVDERADLRQGLAAPVAQFLDSLVDELGGGFAGGFLHRQSVF